MQTLDKTSDKLILVEVERDSDSVNTRYQCNVEVVLAGDSIWDCEVERVTVTDITVSDSYEDNGEWICRHIGVAHTGGDESWRIYTDSGFAEAISELLGFEVYYTEQGMQDDGYASME